MANFWERAAHSVNRMFSLLCLFAVRKVSQGTARLKVGPRYRKVGTRYRKVDKILQGTAR